MDSELTVSEIWRYPVKSMAGERLDQAEVGPRGIAGDRGWAVRDEKAGTIRSARYIPRLLLCSARYLPGTDAGLVPHVAITLPDGTTVNSDDSRINQRLSDAMGRELTLWPRKPDDDDAHLRQGAGALETGDMGSEMRMLFGLLPDEPLPDMRGMPAHLVRELSEFAAPKGTYFDAFPIDVLTTSSVRHLQQHLPDVPLDVRRFRPNFLIDDGGAWDAPREAAWVGHRLRVGEIVLNAIMECPRCTIIAAEQAGGIVRNSAITRTIVREMQQLLSVYCTVRASGTVRTGDPVRVEHA